MGRGRRFDKKSRTRPTKGGCERKRREKVQKKRLVALGLKESEVKKMNAKQVRQVLRRPAKIKAAQ